MSTRALLAATRLSRRRLMRLRAPRSADMMLQSWLVVVVFARFAANCAAAARELLRDGGVVGPALAPFTMLHFVLVAFLLSFLSAASSLGAAGLDRRRLVLTGVRIRHEVLAQLLALGSWPMTAVIGLFLVPAAFVVARLPRPGAAALGLLLAFASALALGALLGMAVTLNRAWRRLAGGFRLVVMAALFALVFANFDFDWAAGNVRLFVFQHPLLLHDPSGAGLLPALQGWGPWSWIAEGRVVPCLVLALCSAAAYALGAGRALVRAGAIDPATELRGRPRLRGVSRLPSLYGLELRRLALSGPGTVALGAGVGGAAWLAFTRHPVAGIPLLAGFLILTAGLSTAANVFGADGGAVRRFALSGFPWHRVYMVRNAAWLTAVSACLVPLLAATAVRLDGGAAVSIVAVYALGLAAAVAWGNLGSLLFAAPSLPGRAPREGPSFVSQAAPLLLAAAVLGINETVSPLGTPGFTGTVLALAALCAVLAAAYLRRVAQAFDDEVEVLLERLRA